MPLIPRLEEGTAIRCVTDPQFVRALEGENVVPLLEGTAEDFDYRLSEIARYCAGCPLKRSCRKASGVGFTGVAGGYLYVNGRLRRRPLQEGESLDEIVELITGDIEDREDGADQGCAA